MPISHDGNIDLVFFGSQAISDVYHGTDLVYTKFRDRLYTVPGVYTMAIPRGYYQVVVRGGGGAGGDGATQSSGTRYLPQGTGGAGGKGQIDDATFVLTQAVNATIQVGAGGLTYANGGNGGAPGDSDKAQGGAGGGGGHASYLMMDTEVADVPYYGWATQPVSSGIYEGPTTTFYITYNNDNPQLAYISSTRLDGDYGSFVLINGQTYTNNQQLYYYSDSSTLEATIAINNGTVTLEAVGTNDLANTYTPLDVSSQFVGGVVLTQTDTPAVNDTVYDETFTAVGVITSIVGTTIEYNSVFYSTYSAKDTTHEEVINTDMYCAQGGGGGGGSGTGRVEYSRYGTGGGGAGGGGYYYTDINGIEINYAGKKGGNGGVHNSGVPTGVGVAGNAMFPNCYSTGGTKGTEGTVGGPGATGGGASGGAGGFCGNESHDWASTGAGGAGAGGDYDAGGGGAGYDTAAAYNYHTVPTSTTAENLAYGVTGDYGVGGTTSTNGSSGFVYLKRLGRIIDPEIIDLGMVATAVPDSIDDAGTIDGAVSETEDAGEITGTVSETDNAGAIFVPTDSTPWVLGSITDAVSDTTDCGNIM